MQLRTSRDKHLHALLSVASVYLLSLSVHAKKQYYSVQPIQTFVERTPNSLAFGKHAHQLPARCKNGKCKMFPPSSGFGIFTPGLCAALGVGNFPVSDDCRSYLQCITPYGTPSRQTCEKGSYFVSTDAIGFCVGGSCQGEMPACFKMGIGKFSITGVCDSYLECTTLYESPVKKTCDRGSYFDSTKAGACVQGLCPGAAPPCFFIGVAKHPIADDCHSYWECTTTSGKATKKTCDKGFRFIVTESIVGCILGDCTDAQAYGHCKTMGPGKFSILSDCHSYLECQKSYGTPVKKSCPLGSYFDLGEVDCVRGYCPGEEPHNTCYLLSVGKHTIEGDCYSYLECTVSFNDPVAKTCPKGSYFDVNIKECVVGKCPDPSLKPSSRNSLPEPASSEDCPMLKVLPDEHKCSAPYALHASPENCRKYYRCLPTATNSDGWCYSKFLYCPYGQYFDEQKRTCVKGNCPIMLMPETVLPPSTKCKFLGIGKFGLPDDCYSYLECTSNQGTAKIKTCPFGSFYEGEFGVCIVGPCPVCSECAATWSRSA